MIGSGLQHAGSCHQSVDEFSRRCHPGVVERITGVCCQLPGITSGDRHEGGKTSIYAKRAKEAGLDIITWTLERSGTLTDGGGWYYQSISDVVDNSGDTYALLDVLAKDVGVIGVFSDWPATVTYYASCMKLN